MTNTERHDGPHEAVALYLDQEADRWLKQAGRAIDHLDAVWARRVAAEYRAAAAALRRVRS